MDKLIIEGGHTLKGEIYVSGSKNSALPIMAATLLTDEPCVLTNVPRLRDSLTMARLLRALGKSVDFDKNKMVVTSKGSPQYEAPYSLVSTMRGSFCVLGPLLGKLKKAKVSLPGGCLIGVRPVNLHLKGIQALGAKIHYENGNVVATAGRLRGSHMYLGGVFGSSVLATGNVMMAATLASGETIIESAACEPEVEELGDFLNKMGAKVHGHGTPKVTIQGVKRLHGAQYRIGPDRIEAGSFVLMAAATRSNIAIRNACYPHLFSLVDKLENVGIEIKQDKDVLRVHCRRTLKPTSVTTHPYPGFATDLQAQFMSLMAVVPGVSVISDKIFPDRFIHIAELNRMGANIRREGINAIVEGVKHLYGAPVMASDLRASAALVIAGLAAKGKTEIHRIYHLERGYENIDEKLKGIGAKVYREKE